MTPAIMVFVAFPVVSVFAPRLAVEVAPPAKDPIVSAPDSVRSPVPVKTTAAVSSKAAPSTLILALVATFTTADASDPVTTNEPPVTVVAPV